MKSLRGWLEQRAWRPSAQAQAAQAARLTEAQAVVGDAIAEAQTVQARLTDLDRLVEAFRREEDEARASGRRAPARVGRLPRKRRAGGNLATCRGRRRLAPA